VGAVDTLSSAAVYGVTKALRNIPRSPVRTQNVLGWTAFARPTVGGGYLGTWRPYGGGAPHGRITPPTWQWQRPVAAVKAPETFDPNAVFEGIKERSPELWTAYNRWISNAIIEDAQTIGRVLAERFPANLVDNLGNPDPRAGQPRYAAFQPAFRVANLRERAQRLDRARRALAPGHPNRRLFARQAIFLRLRADAAARQEGFANAAAAVALRDAHLDHLFDVNAMNMTNILQRDFERQEVQQILKLVVKLHRKELWHFAKYGYIGYNGLHKKQADLSHGRLLGLLQEVDPLHGRRQGVPIAL